jgi:hypothetical protein
LGDDQPSAESPGGLNLALAIAPNASRRTAMDRRPAQLRVLSSIACGVALVFAGVATARAQDSHINDSKGRRVFEWSGHVERDLELVISGRNYVATRIGSAEKVSRGTAEVLDLPRENGELVIRTAEGRGQVEVAQQPATENGYTAVIRVRDPEGGTGMYHFSAYWQGVAAGEVVPFTEPAREPPTPGEIVRERMRRVAVMWAGDVDGDLEIVVEPTGVSYRTLRGLAPRALQSAISQGPFQDAQLEVERTDGRGEIEVTQQPGPDNGYTTRIRIRDPQPGFGHYAFNLLWR